jgi:hypothetical protein
LPCHHPSDHSKPPKPSLLLCFTQPPITFPAGRDELEEECMTEGVEDIYLVEQEKEMYEWILSSGEANRDEFQEQE